MAISSPFIRKIMPTNSFTVSFVRITEPVNRHLKAMSWWGGVSVGLKVWKSHGKSHGLVRQSFKQFGSRTRFKSYWNRFLRFCFLLSQIQIPGHVQSRRHSLANLENRIWG